MITNSNRWSLLAPPSYCGARADGRGILLRSQLRHGQALLRARREDVPEGALVPRARAHAALPTRVLAAARAPPRVRVHVGRPIVEPPLVGARGGARARRAARARQGAAFRWAPRRSRQGTHHLDHDDHRRLFRWRRRASTGAGALSAAHLAHLARPRWHAVAPLMHGRLVDALDRPRRVCDARDRAQIAPGRRARPERAPAERVRPVAQHDAQQPPARRE